MTICVWQYAWYTFFFTKVYSKSVIVVYFGPDNMMRDSAAATSVADPQPDGDDTWNKNLQSSVKFAGDDDDNFGFEEVTDWN